MQTNNNSTSFRIRTNHYIKVPQVRLLDAEGQSLGVFATADALKKAKELGVDLIEINPKASPPVCKLEEFGKYKYEEKKRANSARKNQKTSELKELSFRPNTDVGDLTHKMESAKAFLSEGDKVKFAVKFRGREMSHPQVGYDKLVWLVEQLTTLVGSQTPITTEGKVMSVVLSPKSS